MIAARIPTSIRPAYGFMLLPPTTESGAVIHLSRVASSHVMPEFERARVSEVRYRPGRLANYAVKAGAQSIVAFLRRVLTQLVLNAL